MRIAKLARIMLAAAVVALLGGCGSGGNGSSPHTFVSKSTLDGPVSPAVKGVEVTLVLPAGVIPRSDSATSLTPGQPADITEFKTNDQPPVNVVTALAPNNVTSSNGSLIAVYTPASGTTPGKVKITVIRGDSGFTAGDFFSMACVVAAGKTVAATDFTTDGPPKIWDANGADISSTSGATATITTQAF